MASMKAQSVQDYQLLGSFEVVRQELLQARCVDRLEKPLAYWALPSDRRLPLAFLGRTVGELLDTPFERLLSTPGIGQKKIRSLVQLLQRAIDDQPPLAPLGQEQVATSPSASCPGNGKFDPALVSEALWVQWRDTVRRNGLGREKLGRLVLSLQSLPTVIWHTPLDAYLDYTIAEMRLLKTHGEKRIRAILEVFYTVHQLLEQAGTCHHLAICLTPRFITRLEVWLDEALRRADLPSPAQLRRELATPLLDQLRVDGGAALAELASGRLGVGTAPQSVRLQSQRMGVTRARVYQLFDECARILEVRWPEGRCRLNELGDKLQRDGAHPDTLELLDELRELFYPEKQERLAEATFS